MLSYVNITTTVNNKINIYLGKKHMRKFSISRYSYNCLHNHREESSGRMDSNGELHVPANYFVSNFMLPHFIFLR